MSRCESPSGEDSFQRFEEILSKHLRTDLFRRHILDYLLQSGVVISGRGSASLSAFDKSVDEADTRALAEWLHDQASIKQSYASQYADCFMRDGICTIGRLAKKLATNEKYLIDIGVKSDDADEIRHSVDKYVGKNSNRVTSKTISEEKIATIHLTVNETMKEIELNENPNKDEIVPLGSSPRAKSETDSLPGIIIDMTMDGFEDKEHADPTTLGSIRTESPVKAPTMDSPIQRTFETNTLVDHKEVSSNPLLQPNNSREEIKIQEPKITQSSKEETPTPFNEDGNSEGATTNEDVNGASKYYTNTFNLKGNVSADPSPSGQPQADDTVTPTRPAVSRMPSVGVVATPKSAEAIAHDQNRLRHYQQLGQATVVVGNSANGGLGVNLLASDRRRALSATRSTNIRTPPNQLATAAVSNQNTPNSKFSASPNNSYNQSQVVNSPLMQNNNSAPINNMQSKPTFVKPSLQTVRETNSMNSISSAQLPTPNTSPQSIRGRGAPTHAPMVRNNSENSLSDYLERGGSSNKSSDPSKGMAQPSAGSHRSMKRLDGNPNVYIGDNRTALSAYQTLIAQSNHSNHQMQLHNNSTGSMSTAGSGGQSFIRRTSFNNFNNAANYNNNNNSPNLPSQSQLNGMNGSNQSEEEMRMRQRQSNTRKSLSSATFPVVSYEPSNPSNPSNNSANNGPVPTYSGRSISASSGHSSYLVTSQSVGNATMSSHSGSQQRNYPGNSGSNNVRVSPSQSFLNSMNCCGPSQENLSQLASQQNPSSMLGNHHPSCYEDGRWQCCRKVDPATAGCKGGEVRHHPNRRDKNTLNWMCCNGVLLSTGCQPGPHPRNMMMMNYLTKSNHFN